MSNSSVLGEQAFGREQQQFAKQLHSVTASSRALHTFAEWETEVPTQSDLPEVTLEAGSAGTGISNLTGSGPALLSTALEIGSSSLV